MVDSVLSHTFNWLRFPMAVAVVLIHAGSRGGAGYGTDAFSVLSVFLCEGLFRIAVPTFFLISGYLFFNKLEFWSGTVWLSKLKTRIRSLIFPYIVWNILAFFIIWLYSVIRGHINGTELTTLPTFFNEVGGLNCLWGGDDGMPIDFPLYFVRDLIVYVFLLSPLIWLVMSKLKIVGIAVLGVLFFFFNWLPSGLFFFSAGAYMSINGLDVLPNFRRIKWYFYVVAVCSLVVFTATYFSDIRISAYLLKVYLLSGVAAVFCIAGSLVEKKKLSLNYSLAETSFFIFASHGILILHDFANWIILHIFPIGTFVISVLATFTKAAIAVGICLLLYYSMKRICPRILSFLCGNRMNALQPIEP